MIIIGEKINGSIPSVAEAIAKRDAAFIKERARMQAQANATFIDCCASVEEKVEVETLEWMIDCIQEVTDLPISVDSPSAEVLAQAYKHCKRPGLINSVSMEGDKADKIFKEVADSDGRLSVCSATTRGFPRLPGTA
ncbi:MAG: dihydropteroate synthase [Blautia sp.]